MFRKKLWQGLVFLLGLSAVISKSFASVAPVIISVSSTSGIPLITTMTILGSNFNDTTSNNIVYFGATQANVISATATSMIVVVPLGASCTNISVLNATTRLSCYYSDLFTPSYDNNGYIPFSQNFKPRFDIPITTTAFGPTPYHAAMGDMDGDGMPDMIVCTYDPVIAGVSIVQVFRNIGGQGRVAFDTPVICASSSGGRIVKLADMDGDGKLDVLVACSGSGRISVIRNLSTAGNILMASQLNLRLSSGPTDVVVADFDGDGKPDIAGVVYDSGDVELFRNKIQSPLTGAFTSSSFTNYHVSFAVPGIVPYPGSLVAGDFDGDGMIDIATSNYHTGNISVFRNRSMADTFMFDTPVSFPTGVSNSLLLELKAADINNDRKPDLVVADKGTNSLRVFQNNATPGVINTASFLPSVGFPSILPLGLDFGDFNGDGKVDVAVSNNSTDSVSLFYNTNTPGNITTTSLVLFKKYPSGSQPAGVSVGDLDGDTKSDIIVANSGSNTISIFENYAVPDTTPIVGIDSVCVSNSIVLRSTHAAGVAGFWSVTNNHASVTFTTGATDTSVTFSGLSAGTDTLVYAVVALYDTNYVRKIIRVLAIADTGIISGPSALCAATSISLSETASGGIWSSSDTTIAKVDSVTGRVTGIAPGSATIFYTAQSVSCGPLSASHAVTVNSLPNAGLISGGNGTCVGSTLALTASVPGGYWVNEHPTVASGLPSGTTAVLTATSVGADTILHIVTSLFCGSDTAFKTIGVIATGVSLPIIGSPNVCFNDSVILANAAGGGVWSSSNPAVASVNPVTGAVTGRAVGVAVISYLVAYNCGPVLTLFNITVSPLPVASSISGPTHVCAGANISLTGSGSFGSYSWSSSNTLTATVGAASGVVTGVAAGIDTIFFSVTNGCGIDSIYRVDTVKPLPLPGIIIGADSVCTGAVITLSNPTGDPSGSWSSNSGSVATVVGGVVTGAGAGTALISYSVTNSCGTLSDTASVRVDPVPSVFTIINQVLCTNTNSTPVIFTGPVPGSAYSWANGNTSIGLANSGTGNIASFVALNATTTPVVSIVTVTPTAHGCIGTTGTFSVTVEPLPQLNSPLLSPPVCSGSLFTYTSSSSSPGASFSWSRPVTAGISNASGSGPGNPSEILFNTTPYPVAVSYTDTIKINACANTQTVTVTVNPSPHLSSPLTPPAVCDGATFNYIPASLTAGSAFAWSRDTITGCSNSAANGTGSISEALFDTTYGLIQVTYYDTLTANGCKSVDTIRLIVKPTPRLSSILNAPPICDSTAFNYTPGSATLYTTFSWSRPVVAGIANTYDTGSGNPNEYLHNTSNSPVIATYIYSLVATGCTSIQDVTVTVEPDPLLSSSLTPPAICSGDTFNYVPSGAVTGSVFNWSRNSISGISNLSSSGTGNPSEVLTDTTFSTISVGYTYVVTANSCTDTQQVIVQVKPDPKLSSTLSDTICSGSSFGYTPSCVLAGTAFAWNRPTVTGLSNPTASGIGNIVDTPLNITYHTVVAVYVYTLSTNGCNATEDISVAVQPRPARALITTKSPAAVCTNTMFQNFGTSSIIADSMQYSWSAINATIWATGSTHQYCLVNFNTPGNAAVVLTSGVAGTGCANNDTFDVSVGPGISDTPSVLHLHYQFACLPGDETTYQWGYDDAQLDSTLLTGEIQQDYINSAPDPAKYYWVMTTKNGCAQKTYYKTPTALTDVSGLTASINLYPNPSDNILVAELDNIHGRKTGFSIFNMMGQQIKEAGAPDGKAKFDVSGLPPGSYIVYAFIDGVKVATAKFIKR